MEHEMRALTLQSLVLKVEGWVKLVTECLCLKRCETRKTVTPVERGCAVESHHPLEYMEPASPDQGLPFPFD